MLFKSHGQELVACDRTQGELDDVFNLCDDFGGEVEQGFHLILGRQDILEVMHSWDDDNVAEDAHATAHEIEQAHDEAMHLDGGRGAIERIEESTAEEHGMLRTAMCERIHPLCAHDPRSLDIGHGVCGGGTKIDEIEGCVIGLVVFGQAHEDGAHARRPLADVSLQRSSGSLRAKDVMNPVLDLFIFNGAVCGYVWHANVCDGVNILIVCKLNVLNAKAGDFAHLHSLYVR